MECHEMQELLENLRFEFKSRQSMQIGEELQKVEATSLIRSFLDTHAKLATNGQNLMQLCIRPAFPMNIRIPLINIDSKKPFCHTSNLNHKLMIELNLSRISS